MIKKFLNTFYGTVASLKVPDSTVSDNFEEKGKSQAWNKSSNLYLNIIKIDVKSNKEEVEKRWKKENSDTNNSTISLNITAYENSIEAVSNHFNDNAEIGKEKFGIAKPIVSASTLLIQNPFEFPRQQNYTVPQPEVSQYKASQRLVTPTKESGKYHGNYCFIYWGALDPHSNSLIFSIQKSEAHQKNFYKLDLCNLNF